MSHIHINIKLKQDDPFMPEITNEETILTISLDHRDGNRMLRNHLLSDLHKLNLTLGNVMHDLIHLALAVYTIDQTVSRKDNGFQGWSRYLSVYFPTNNAELWNSTKEQLERYIGFLSGDKWEFHFRQNQEIRINEVIDNPNPSNFTKVCLLSGGLDSFVASIDLLSSEDEKPFFVSHYKVGTDSNTQDKIISALKENFKDKEFGSHQFFIQPNQKHENAQKENSSRARSLLFIILGLTVANCLGENVPLILPENGLISLNIPLTKSRISSHSTRTTHPYFVDGINQITSILGIPNRVINPYRFKTKGEMTVECADSEFLKNNIEHTISCSHPEQSRYLKKRPGLNCGYCVPCIIRQAAEHRAGEILTEYAIDDVRRTPPSQKTPKGSDYRAFKLALERLDTITKPHSFALEILRAGPIPTDENSPLSEYISVFKRGMDEVKQFLNS
jgi:7-cyano-7-deazaguanine synthase in queuosine biosynthesis